ncbi:PA14 domain-containing protein [Lentisphaerota bacterium WC36G]|nr:hypothetical protein LJT99_05815 [Lentisphaerae bacterium WC36]
MNSNIKYFLIFYLALLTNYLFASNKSFLEFSYQNVTPSSAAIKWETESNTEVQNFKIYCDNVLIATTPNMEFIHNSLAPNQTYNFTVKAIDKYDSEIDSKSITLRTLNSNKSNFSLLRHYPYKRLGILTKYFDGVMDTVDELYPNPEDYYRKYDDPSKWYNSYNIDARKPYRTEIRNSINFNFYEDGFQKVLNSDKDKFLAITFEGFLVIQETGEYTFKTEHDNSYILNIDNKEQVNVMKFRYRDDHTVKKIKLFSGIHPVKITYYEFSGVKSTLLMQWSGPRFRFQPLDGFHFVQLSDKTKDYLKLDADFDGVLDSLEEKKLSSNHSWDTDNDGLTDYEEIMKYNSLPNKVDSDGDGIPDGIEAKILLTDLLKKDNIIAAEKVFSNIKKSVKHDALSISWNLLRDSVNNVEVYRNFNHVKTVQNNMIKLPIISANDVYYLVAVDNDGSKSYTKVGPLKLTRDQLNYLDWKAEKKLPLSATYENDSDNDNRNKYQEFTLDSNPEVAPISTIKRLKKYPGFFATYYNAMWSPSSFNNIDAFKTGVVETLAFDAGEGEVLDSGKKDGLGILFKGYFEAPKAGLYKFLISHDDSIKVYIDKVLVYEDKCWNKAGRIWQKKLDKGVHLIEVAYSENKGAALLDLKWAPPGESLKTIDKNAFWHVKKFENELNEAITWNKDSDNDGLSNRIELEYGSNIHSIDTDGDSLSDYDEIYVYKTSPTYKDSDGDGISDGDEVNIFNSNPIKENLAIESFKTIKKFDGSEYSSKMGKWTKIDSSVESRCAIGSLEFKFNTTTNSNIKVVLNGQLKDIRDYKVDLYCDKVLIFSKKYDITDQAKALNIETFTQFLKPGKHTLKLFLDNPTTRNILKVSSIKFLLPDGPNIKKWQREHAINMSKLDFIPDESKVSPLFLEGKNNFAELITINNKKVDSYDNNKWFKKVALSEDNKKNKFTFKFQNDINKVTKTIKWTTTNIMTEKNNIDLRVGDSLLLTIKNLVNADPITKDKKIVINGQVHDLNSEYIKYKFDTPGFYQITGSYKNSANELIENKFVINVHSYNFDKKLLTFTTNSIVKTSIPTIPSGCYLTTSSKDVKFIVNGKTLYLDSREWNKKQLVFIRAKSNNKIIATLPLKIIRFYNTLFNKFFVKSKDNGTVQLIEYHSICYPIADNMIIKYNIYLNGLTFKNGLRVKLLKAGNFDETGTAVLNFLKPSSTPKTTNNSDIFLIVDGKYIQQIN